MGSSVLNIAIEDKFKTSWGTTTPISYDNLPFDVPLTNWVRLEVWDGDATKASLGTGVQLRRSSGTVFITIYSVLSQGSKPARDLADQVATVFRDIQLSGLIFFEPSVKRLGEVYHTGGGDRGSTAQWYQIIVSIPFINNQYI